MRLYNTLTGKKEELERPAGRPLKLFVCGPTVYDYSHLGHARTYFAYDAFVRYLSSEGWNVFYLENITNVDDKIIARAKEAAENPLRLADRFERAFREDMRALGISSVDKYAKATDYIPEIERQVRVLMQKGFAYAIPDDGIYYDISQFKDYGQLSHRTAAQAEDAVSRIDESVRKKNRGDFCLWKFPKSPVRAPFYKRFLVTKDGEPAWKTSLGWGRPGWHIEDTAITNKEFGPQYDVHGGAVELKFPHHEAEIAQQEAASGKSPLVKIWMHTGLLTIGGQAMHKSLHNFVTIREALERHSAETLRYLFLSAHYRSPMDYSAEAAAVAEASLKSVRAFLAKLAFAEKRTLNQKPSPDIEKLIAGTDHAFREALEDDFNTPAALGAVFALIGGVQPFIWALSPGDLRLLGRALAEKFAILGFDSWKTEIIPQNIAALAQKRELSRKSAQFTQADALRKAIEALGYSIEDTPLGPFVFKN